MNAIIIGFGRMGQRYNDILSQLGIQVSAIFDKNPNLIANTPIYSPEILYGFCNKNKPMLVVIATTAESHFEYLQFCFDFEIPYVLCEKPVCTSLQQAERLLEMNKKFQDRVTIAINHQMAFMEQYKIVKKLIATEKFGSLCSMSVQAGNMGIAMNAIHYIEAFRFITNEKPERVWGWLKLQSKENPRGHQFQDFAGCMRIETQSKQRLYLDLSEEQGHGIFVTYTCNYGQIHIDDLTGNVYINYRKNTKDRNLASSFYALSAETKITSIKPIDVYESTKDVILSLLKKENYPTIQNAISSIKAIIAAWHSTEMGGIPININQVPVSLNNKSFAWA